MSEKAELSDEDVLSLARAALRERDPVPPGVADLAHLAIEFDDLVTVTAEAPASGELVGVRSGANTARREARHHRVTLSWEPGAQSIVGLVRANDGLEVSVHLQELSEPESHLGVTADGSFDCALPMRPFRFVVRGDAETWATDWQR